MTELTEELESIVASTSEAYVEAVKSFLRTTVDAYQTAWGEHRFGPKFPRGFVQEMISAQVVLAQVPLRAAFVGYDKLDIETIHKVAVSHGFSKITGVAIIDELITEGTFSWIRSVWDSEQVVERVVHETTK